MRNRPRGYTYPHNSICLWINCDGDDAGQNKSTIILPFNTPTDRRHLALIRRPTFEMELPDHEADMRKALVFHSLSDEPGCPCIALFLWWEAAVGAAAGASSNTAWSIRVGKLGRYTVPHFIRRLVSAARKVRKTTCEKQ